MFKKYLYFFFLISSSCVAQSSFFVAPLLSGGDDTNIGSQQSPFATVNHALSVMSAGDTCFLREGNYHEDIVISNRHASMGTPTVIMPYNNEHVVMDGTKPIISTWTNYTGNIFKTTLSEHIWQLFVDSSQVVMARWPNAQFHDESIFRKSNWAQGIENSSTNGYEEVDAAHHDLAATGLDLTGALGILNVGSFKTWTQPILSHSVGTNNFTYTNVPNSGYRTKHHYFFAEGKLELLDSPNEWFYDTLTMTLYYYPDDGQNPTGRLIQGKTQTYALQIQNVSHLEIKGLYFFSTTFDASASEYLLVEDCHFAFPNCSQRMLGNDGLPKVTQFGRGGNTNGLTKSRLNRCLFEHTDGEALRIDGDSNTIENCYFHHIDYSVSDLENLMVTFNVKGNANVFTKNTVHSTGASSVLVPGSGSVFSYNNITQTGFLQTDGAVLQGTHSSVANSDLHHNWIYQTPKYALRYDAPANDPTIAGKYGKIHHNVIWETNGIMAKGNKHYICHNTCFSNNGNGLIVLDESGSNDSTYTQNNFAVKLSAHRSQSVISHPVPGFISNNWNGYEHTGVNFTNILDTNSFFPQTNSALIDSGIVIPNIPHPIVGAAPDIGAYEMGAASWTTGVDWQPNFYPWTFNNSTVGFSNAPAIMDQYLVYPNPLNSVLNIKHKTNKLIDTEIKIIDTYGKILLEKHFNKNSIEIELNNWANGIYWLSIESKDGVQLKPIVKVNEK